MTFKPKNNRHVPTTFDDRLFAERAESWTAGILNTEIAELFAQIVSGFEHIENSMEVFLAQLLGTIEIEPAQCIYRTIRTPNIRQQVLENLLRKAPKNAKLGTEYDQLLKKFESVRTRRNDIAHALWWTDQKFQTYIAKPGSNYYPILSARMIETSELQNIFDHQVEFGHDLRHLVLKPIEKRQARAKKRRKSR